MNFPNPLLASFPINAHLRFSEQRQLTPKQCVNSNAGTDSLYVTRNVLSLPDEIDDFCSDFGFPITGMSRQELHCTVMYSPDTACSTIPFLDRANCTAYIDDVDFWEGDGTGYVVLKLTPDLNLLKRFSYWKSVGCISTYEQYTPHVTLAKNISISNRELKRMSSALGSYSSNLRILLSAERCYSLNEREPLTKDAYGVPNLPLL